MTGGAGESGGRSTDRVAPNGESVDGGLADGRSVNGGSEDGARARTHAVERLLARHGIEFAGVKAAGHAGDIAAVTASAASRARLEDLASEIKALGFKYVALELGPGA